MRARPDVHGVGVGEPFGSGRITHGPEIDWGPLWLNGISTLGRKGRGAVFGRWYFSRLSRPVSTLCLVHAWEGVSFVSLITLSILFRSFGRSAPSGHPSLFRWLPGSRVASQPIHWATGWDFLLLAGVWGDGGGCHCRPLYSSPPPDGASLFLGVPCWFLSLFGVFQLVFLGLRGHKPQAAYFLRLEATFV